MKRVRRRLKTRLTDFHDVLVLGFLCLDELGALVQSGRWVSGLQQRAGGAAGQLGAVEREAVAVGGAGAHGQQVVVAGDVAVPGQIVRVLGVNGHRHAAGGGLDDTDGGFWEDETSETSYTQSYLRHLTQQHYSNGPTSPPPSFPTHVVDVLGGHRGGGGGDDGGGAAVGHVLTASRRLHLHVAALRVFAQSRRVVDGGVRVLAVQGAGAGQGALHVVWGDEERENQPARPQIKPSPPLDKNRIKASECASVRVQIESAVKLLCHTDDNN